MKIGQEYHLSLATKARKAWDKEVTKIGYGVNIIGNFYKKIRQIFLQIKHKLVFQPQNAVNIKCFIILNRINSEDTNEINKYTMSL